MVSDSKTSVIIQSLGAYEPEKVLTNDDLSTIVDTNDEWITTRTGIKERRIASEKESPSQMGILAAQKALEKANLHATDIDLIIVATVTPDMPFPSTACLIQEKLGLKGVPAFDIQAACSGFLYGLEVTSSMMRGGHYKHALLIGVEKMSSILDWEDRSTCVLFGDGAGAAVLSKVETPNAGIIDSLLQADGQFGELLYVPSANSTCRPTSESLEQGNHFLKMDGRAVYKHAVRTMEEAALQTLQRNNLTPQDIDHFIPHQANLRIIESLASRMNVSMDKFVLTLQKHGNTSAASIPLAMEHAFSQNQFKSGDKILMLAFGAGLTWAATLIIWQ